MNGSDLRSIALSLEGVSEAPHFDRAAFRYAKIFVTLAADGLTANFKFTPDQQEWISAWRGGCVWVIRDVSQAVDVAQQAAKGWLHDSDTPTRLVPHPPGLGRSQGELCLRGAEVQ